MASSSSSSLLYELKCISVFRKSDLDDSQYRELVQRADVRSYVTNEKIITHGQETEAALYLVVSGKVWLQRTGKAPVMLLSGCNFGEEMMQFAEGKEISQVVPQYSVWAADDTCKCAVLTMDTCRQVFDIDKADKGDDVQGSRLDGGIRGFTTTHEKRTTSAVLTQTKKKNTESKGAGGKKKDKDKKKKKKDPVNKSSPEGEPATDSGHFEVASEPFEADTSTTQLAQADAPVEISNDQEAKEEEEEDHEGEGNDVVPELELEDVFRPTPNEEDEQIQDPRPKSGPWTPKEKRAKKIPDSKFNQSYNFESEREKDINRRGSLPSASWIKDKIVETPVVVKKLPEPPAWVTEKKFNPSRRASWIKMEDKSENKEDGSNRSILESNSTDSVASEEVNTIVPQLESKEPEKTPDLTAPPIEIHDPTPPVPRPPPPQPPLPEPEPQLPAPQKPETKKPADKRSSTGPSVGAARQFFQTQVVKHATIPRPKNVFQKPISTPDNYKAPVYPKTAKEETTIREALDKRFVFQGLPEEMLDALASAFQKKHVPAGNQIVTQGEIDDSFYIVMNGEVEFKVDGEHAGGAKTGEAFGEEALVFSGPRASSVWTKTGTDLFRVDQTTFRRLLETETKQNDSHKKSLLQKIDFLQSVSPENLNKLVAIMTPKKFKKGEVLARKDDYGKVFHVIDEGEVQLKDRQVDNRPKADMTVKQGEFFGEEAVLGQDRSTKATAVALTSGKAYAIEASKYRTALGNAAKLIPIEGRTLYAVQALNRDSQPLTDKDTLKLIGRISNREYAPGEVIIQEGVEIDAAIYFLRLGKANSMKRRMLTLHTVGTHFGEELFLSAKQANSTRGVSPIQVTAHEECTCGVLSMKDYYEAFADAKSTTTPVVVKEKPLPASRPPEDKAVVKEKPPPSKIPGDKVVVNKETPPLPPPPSAVIQETIAIPESPSKHSSTKEVRTDWKPDITAQSAELKPDVAMAALVEPLEPPAERRPSERRPKSDIKLENLVKKVILGEGNFGQVWLCMDKTATQPTPLVLKIQSKYHLVSEGEDQVCIQEKNLLFDVNHSFIIKLFNTYQDEAFVYMLLDFVQGGELFSVMNPSDRICLSEEQAKFYALTMADALAYLHTKKYAYRDLKPENILIDGLGYPKLIDFGFAKIVTDKTYTLCGTPGYLAPEVVLNRGHNWAADHWSLGVLIHEMISGSSPFYEEDLDQMELFRSIIEDDYRAVTGVCKEARDLIDKLLVKEPALRFGSLVRGEADILQHEWFAGLNLTQLYQRQMEAPWRPNIKDPFDTSNFDDWSSLEDKTLDKGPKLTPKQAALFDSF